MFLAELHGHYNQTQPWRSTLLLKLETRQFLSILRVIHPQQLALLPRRELGPLYCCLVLKYCIQSVCRSSAVISVPPIDVLPLKFMVLSIIAATFFPWLSSFYLGRFVLTAYF